MRRLRGRIRDRSCADLTVCGATQYETVAATDNSDRSCADLTVCGATQYETVAATDTSDRSCADLTVCGPNASQVDPPTLTSDRTCACDAGYQGDGVTCIEILDPCPSDP